MTVIVGTLLAKHENGAIRIHSRPCSWRLCVGHGLTVCEDMGDI